MLFFMGCVFLHIRVRRFCCYAVVLRVVSTHFLLVKGEEKVVGIGTDFVYSNAMTERPAEGKER
jgi:hypothetical protein